MKLIITDNETGKTTTRDDFDYDSELIEAAAGAMIREVDNYDRSLEDEGLETSLRLISQSLIDGLAWIDKINDEKKPEDVTVGNLTFRYEDTYLVRQEPQAYNVTFVFPYETTTLTVSTTATEDSPEDITEAALELVSPQRAQELSEAQEITIEEA